MKKLTALEGLMEHSIKITDQMEAFWPQTGQKEKIVVSEIRSKFNGAYSTNNSTIGFSYNNNFYVVPYSKKAVSILEISGLKKVAFYVPFSNWDVPVGYEQKWQKLQEEAKTLIKVEQKEEFRIFSRNNGIQELSTETLEKCLRIPESGIRTIHQFRHYTGMVYPLISGGIDIFSSHLLGKYSKNNGRVVFVYIDGDTYLAKGYGIIRELEASGFKFLDMFVPLSNGEVPNEHFYIKKWESMKKF